MTGKLSETMRIAERIGSLAQEQNGGPLIGLQRTLAITLFYQGDFESSRQYAMRTVQFLLAGDVKSSVEEAYSPAVLCLCHKALCEWHLGIDLCQQTMEKAISLAKDDLYARAVAIWFEATLGHFERNPAKVEHLASDLIERATRGQIPHWLPAGKVFRGWARSALGDGVEGLSCIEDGIRTHRELESTLMVLYWLALKAEALYLKDCLSEALKAIREAEELVEISEERWWSAELRPAPGCVSRSSRR